MTEHDIAGHTDIKRDLPLLLCRLYETGGCILTAIALLLVYRKVFLLDYS